MYDVIGDDQSLKFKLDEASFFYFPETTNRVGPTHFLRSINLRADTMYFGVLGDFKMEL
jgi:hypothetical protein